MNTNLILITFIILLLGFFSSGLFETEHLTGGVVNQPETYSDHIQFTAWQTTGSDGRAGNSRGEGVVEIPLPGKPESCTLEGSWKTNNYLLKALSRPRGYCHEARGTFSSYVDASIQYVTNDADTFRWADISEPSDNPPPETVDGYVLAMWTCDHLYFTGKAHRYYVRANVGEGFGSTNKVSLLWTYYDGENTPAVDFDFDITCTLKNDKPVHQKITLKASQPKVEQPTSMAQSQEGQAFQADVRDIEQTPVPSQTKGWGGFFGWLRSVFMD